MRKIYFRILIVFLAIVSGPVYAQQAPGAVDSARRQEQAAATTLYKAILESESPQSIKELTELIGKGADIQATAQDGWSLLHEAAMQGDVAAITLCINSHIPVDAPYTTAYSKTTPLYWAVQYEHADAVKLLQQNGATFGIPDGMGTQVYDSGNSYTGNFLNGEKVGQGIFYYVDSSRYEGAWDHDQQNGDGTFYWKNGDRYVGQVADNMLAGQGIFYYASGNRYEGEWKDSYQEGKGHFYWLNGDDYEGDFVMGEKSGEGIFNWATCDRYVGHYEHNKQSGKGSFYFENGDIYEGDWKDDMENGTGTFLWTQGHKYVGQFVNNELTGTGTCYWANGERYEGHYDQNIRTGQGRYYWANKDKYFGSFLNNMRSGKGTYFYADGDAYEGDWKFDQKNGEGVFYWKSGDKYEGHFESDTKNGAGTYTVTSKKARRSVSYCPKCKTYKGGWKDGVKSGKGNCYDKKGKLIYSGNFEKDKPKDTYPGIHK